MPEAEPDILSKAIARNSGAVLSLPSEGKLQHHKSRFLNETPEGVWLESIPQERALIQSLIAAAQVCAVSFKSSNQRVSFTATVLKLEQEFRVNETTTLPAVLDCSTGRSQSGAATKQFSCSSPRRCQPDCAPLENSRSFLSDRQTAASLGAGSDTARSQCGRDRRNTSAASR